MSTPSLTSPHNSNSSSSSLSSSSSSFIALSKNPVTTTASLRTSLVSLTSGSVSVSENLPTVSANSTLVDKLSSDNTTAQSPPIDSSKLTTSPAVTTSGTITNSSPSTSSTTFSAALFGGKDNFQFKKEDDSTVNQPTMSVMSDVNIKKEANSILSPIVGSSNPINVGSNGSSSMGGGGNNSPDKRSESIANEEMMSSKDEIQDNVGNTGSNNSLGNAQTNIKKEESELPSDDFGSIGSLTNNGSSDTGNNNSSLDNMQINSNNNTTNLTTQQQLNSSNNGNKLNVGAGNGNANSNRNSTNIANVPTSSSSESTNAQNSTTPINNSSNNGCVSSSTNNNKTIQNNNNNSTNNVNNNSNNNNSNIVNNRNNNNSTNNNNNNNINNNNNNNNSNNNNNNNINNNTNISNNNNVNNNGNNIGNSNNGNSNSSNNANISINNNGSHGNGNNNSNNNTNSNNNNNNNNNGNNNGNYNNKQSSGGNNGGINSLDFTQQQNHIFVFSTQLANQGAESVLNGQFPTIIAYHCAQPSTKKFFEEFFLKNPMKFSKMNRQSLTTSHWIQQQHHINQQSQAINSSNKSLNNKNNNNNNNSSNLLANNLTNNNNNCNNNNSGNSNASNSCNNSNSNNSNNNNNNNNTTNASIVNANTNHSASVNSNRSVSNTKSNGNNLLNTNQQHQQQNSSSGIIGPVGSGGGSSVGFGGDDMSTENEGDLISWDHHANQNLSGIETISNTGKSDGLLPQIRSGNSSPQPNHLISSSCSSTNRSLSQGSGTTSDVNSQSNPSSAILAGATPINNGSTSPNLNSLQPSLQGVKVPDENLTPQQRQHREEQLAKLKKMNQFLFPENTPGTDFSGPNTVTTPIATDPQLESTNAGTPVGSKLIGQMVGAAAMSPGSGPPTNSSSGANHSPGSSLHMLGSNSGPPLSSVNQSSTGMINQSAGLMLGNNTLSGGQCNPLGPGMRGNMLANLNSARIGGQSGPMCRTIGPIVGAHTPDGIMDTSSPNDMNEFNMMIGNQIGGVLGPGNGQQNLMGTGGNSMAAMLGPGSSSINSSASGIIGPGGVAQMEWSKLQQQYYDERSKGKGNTNQLLENINMSGLCNSSQSVSALGRSISGVTQQNNSGGTNGGSGGGPPGIIRQSSQSCLRSQGPPPPYHQTPRSASVPIATQSPNPSSPNNPTSNLSLPSPRTTGGGGGLNSPASESISTGNNSVSNKSQIFKQQDSPVNACGSNNGSAISNSNTNNSANGPGNSLSSLTGTNNRQSSMNHNSNPSTPISSHLSPNASVKDLELGSGNGNAANQDKSRTNTSGPSPQGPRTPSLSGDHSNPASIESRFPPASPNVNFSPVNSVQSQQTSSANNPQMTTSVNSVVGQQPSKMNSTNFMEVSGIKTPTSESSSPSFCLRSDNMPLNPNSNCPPPVKASHFDPISSLAQMSQQLTNSVAGSVNGGNASNPGAMLMGSGGFPGHGMGMLGNEMSSLNNPHGPEGMLGGGGLDMCSGMGIANLNSGPSGMNSNSPQYIMHGPNTGIGNNMGSLGSMMGTRSLSPKLGGVLGFQGNPMGLPPSHRMMARPSMGAGQPGNPYSGANIQVKASTPNTIQYLPARPQVGNQNPRVPPSLDFLPRFGNPLSGNSGIDNGPPNKISASNVSGGGPNLPFYSNCNQMVPGGASNSGILNSNLNSHIDGNPSEGTAGSSSGMMGVGNNVSPVNNNLSGNASNAVNNNMCGQVGQTLLMRGLRPPGQPGMLRMAANIGGGSGSHVGNPIPHSHMFSGPPNIQQSQSGVTPGDPSMFASQIFGGGNVGGGGQGPGHKGNPIMLGGMAGQQINAGGPNNVQMNHDGIQNITSGLSGSGSGNSNVSAGMIGLAGNPNGPGESNLNVSGGPIPSGFKQQSPFVGPSTTDPNYAQQYHNFQQQLYATSTRSQVGNNNVGNSCINSGVNGSGGNLGNPMNHTSNQSFFVPK